MGCAGKGRGPHSSTEGAGTLGNTSFPRRPGAEAGSPFPAPRRGALYPRLPGPQVGGNSGVFFHAVGRAAQPAVAPGRRGKTYPAPGAPHPSPTSSSAQRPEGKRGEAGISPRGGSGSLASRRALSVYGEKGEMEEAGRRRLESAAPPLGRPRSCESGADEGSPGAREARGSLDRSGPNSAPTLRGGSPGSRSCRRRTWGPRRARLPGAARQLRREPSGDGGGAARRPQVRVPGLGAVVRSQPCWVPRRFAP